MLFSLNAARWLRAAPVVCLLIGSTALAAAIDINGDFTDRNGKRPAGWDVQPGVEVRTVDGDPALYVEASGKPAFAARTVPIKDGWRRGTLSARMKAQGLEPGEKNWQTARVVLAFEMPDGERRFTPAPMLERDSDWTTREVNFHIPQGATSIVVQPGVFTQKGGLWVDDIVLNVREAGSAVADDGSAQSSDDAVRESRPAGSAMPRRPMSELPTSDRPRWGEEPVETVSPTRGEVVLNGVWAFQPARSPQPTEAESAWGLIRVPGSWAGGNLAGMINGGEGPAWRGVDLNGLVRAHYRRTIEVPADWQGRTVELRLQRVSTDAEVYVDGELAGEVPWPSGVVDITDHVRPGESATLDVRVVATADAEEVTTFMGPNQVFTSKARLATRGLIGDVVLRSRPTGVHIERVFVQPSVSKGRVDVEAVVSGVDRSTSATLAVEMLNDAGRIAKRFEQRVRLEPDAEQTVRAGAAWPDARQWDLDQPELYTARVALSGAGVEDIYPVRFGFREFTVDGRQLMLNGREVRLRPITGPGYRKNTPQSRDAIRTMIRSIRAAGFNFIESWPRDIADRGTPWQDPDWLAVADEEGMLMSAIAPPMRKHVRAGTAEHWNQPGVQERYRELLHAHMRQVINHPAHLIWSTTPNAFGHPQDQNPRLLGRSRQREGWQDETFSQGWHDRMGLGDEAVEMIKAFDPTRPVMFHQGGPVADVYTLNNYLCFLPLQDREEWLSAWAEDGDMPYMAVEFGTPLQTSFMRGKKGGGWGRWFGAVYSEPLVTEYAAAYLGDEAYTLEQDVYREAIRKRYAPEKSEELGNPKMMYRSFQGRSEIDASPNMQAIQKLFVSRTWRSWRTWGVTGGMVPWADAHGFDTRTPEGMSTVELPDFEPGTRGHWGATAEARRLYLYTDKGGDVLAGGDVLLDHIKDTLAYIGGKPERFTAKDHHFHGGGEVVKQVMLINDARQPIETTWTLVVEVDGQEIDRFEGRRDVPPAQNVKEAVTFRMPSVSKRTAGKLTLRARMGQREHEDVFDFTVYPDQPIRGNADRLTIIDPVGDTSEMLRELGYKVEEVQRPGARQVLVIGRRGLERTEGTGLLGELEPWVRAGGTLLVMGQTPETLERLGFRVQRIIERRVFPVVGSETTPDAGLGLDATDLRDWTGESRLVELYPDYLRAGIPKGNYGGGFPLWGWRWGGYGGVSSVSIEKPHCTSWTPMIECGFDLMYTPAMRMRHGRGHVVMCTLDVEDHHALDPAAAKASRAVIEHALALAPVEPRPVYLLAGERWSGRMKAMGVQAEVVQDIPARAGLLLVGDDAGINDAALNSFARQGGDVVLLPRNTTGSWAGFEYELQEAFSGSLVVPAWAAARGLSASDLRLRVDCPSVTVASGGQIGADGWLGRQTVGNGRVFAVQMNPWSLDTDAEPYLRYTRWRQTRALAQVLSNLGVSFAANERIFSGPTSAQPIDLTGPWALALTQPLPAAAAGNVHRDPGMSAQAERIVAGSRVSVDWQMVETPGLWESRGGAWSETDGEAVYQRTVEVPGEWLGRDLELSLGKLDDYDETYVNGVRVGGIGAEMPKSFAQHRVYRVPGELVSASPLRITVRVFDRIGGGGMGGGEMTLGPSDVSTAGPYHPDYRDDYEYGDDPYRYCRW